MPNRRQVAFIGSVAVAIIGSATAILLTAPVMLLWLVNGGAFLAQHVVRRGTPGAYFALGWVGLVFAQLLYTLVARTRWWAAKR